MLEALASRIEEQEERIEILATQTKTIKAPIESDNVGEISIFGGTIEINFHCINDDGFQLAIQFQEQSSIDD